MNTTTDIRIAPDAIEQMERVGRVLIATDADDDALGRTRRVATQLARRFDWHIVLYDRQNERWTDTPHSSGPHTVDEFGSDERPHLTQQMRDIEGAGASATAWLATVPSITAMIDALQDLDVDAVLLPEQFQNPRLMDRLLIGNDPSAMVDRVAGLHLDDQPVFFTLRNDDTIVVENHGT